MYRHAGVDIKYCQIYVVLYRLTLLNLYEKNKF